MIMVPPMPLGDDPPPQAGGAPIRPVLSRSRSPLLEQPRLSQAGDSGRRSQAQVSPSLRGGHPAPRRTGDHTGADQEGFTHLLDGGGLLPDRDRQRRNPDRAA